LDPLLDKNLLDVEQILKMLKEQNYNDAIKTDFENFSIKANYKVKNILESIGGFFKKIFINVFLFFISFRTLKLI
jgi:hypothetical protein